MAKQYKEIRYKERPKRFKLKKGDQLWYFDHKGNYVFGYYLKFGKVFADVVPSFEAPSGTKKGKKYVWLWNPNETGEIGKANIFIPKSEIIRVRRFNFKR